MCVEASTVLRAVVAKFFFHCRYLEIPSDNQNVLEFLCWKLKPYPRVVFRKSRLFEYCFIYEKFVACREFDFRPSNQYILMRKRRL
jgi:hypothetical protein